MEKLENEFLEAEIAKRGAELVRLYDKTGKREIIWSGDPKYWSYHSPVLFPFVGKLYRGKFRHHGVEYSMPAQHGFARTSMFTLDSRIDQAVTFAMESNGETKKMYPFDFRLAITYALEGKNVRVSWEVVDLSESHHMYFSIGAHPAFRVPAESGSKKSDCYIRFDNYESGTELKYIIPDNKGGGADPSRKFTLQTNNGYLRIREHLFDIDTYIFERGQIEDISLCRPDKSPYVTIHCPHFPYFGIWSPSDEAPFVCLEPWYGRLDDVGFDGGLSEKPGIQVIPPLSSFRADYIIEVH